MATTRMNRVFHVFVIGPCFPSCDYVKIRSFDNIPRRIRTNIMRKPVIAGNWKMYKTLGAAVDTALALKPLVANANHCDVVIAPVFTALKTVADRLEGSNIRVSGQDCSTETEEGAHTGEVLASMLKDVGARYVIVGHSERRQFYCETDVQVNRKTHAGLAAGLMVIMCVGETLDQREPVSYTHLRAHETPEHLV